MNGSAYEKGYRDFSAGRFDAAERSFAEALKEDPNLGPAHFARGCALQRLNRHKEAVASFDAAIALDPKDADSVLNRGVSLTALNRFAEAASAFESVLSTSPNRAEVWLAYGDVLAGANRLEDALGAYAKALSIRPNFPEALNNRGAALFALKRHEEAIQTYDTLRRIQPANATAAINHGIACAELRRYPAALASFERAIAVEPRNAQARYHMATTLLALRRYGEALSSLDAALAIEANNAEAHIVRGLVLRELGRSDEAVVSFSKAIAIKPNSVEALVNRQSLLFDVKRYEEAIRDCNGALSVDPSVPNLRGTRLYYRLQICDWRGIEAEEENVLQRLTKGEPVIQPFMNIALSGTPELQFQCAKIWASREYPAQEPLWRGARYSHERLRVAYLSGDFRDHPVLKQMVGVFEHHDKRHFETLAISLGEDDGSEIRRRAVAAFDDFIDGRGKTDFEIARLLNGMEIDIVIDLMGYTGKSCHEILTHRPAPVQAQFLGFAGTMVSKHVDYLIADRIVVREEDQVHYSERIGYLPDSYMPHDMSRAIGKELSRREAGLPENAFVFCAFNNSYKFSPRMFDVWMRVLKAVPNSILWLTRQNETASNNLKREAQARGVAPERLLWAPFVASNEDHLARLSLADLFLDTVPFNAHSTAMDALWAGVPVLTLSGRTFAGRVGTSLNRAAGLPNMVASSIEEYEAKALQLANDPMALAAIKQTLRRNRHSPLFETARFTRHLETAFRMMSERAQRGELPATFAVEASP